MVLEGCPGTWLGNRVDRARRLRTRCWVDASLFPNSRNGTSPKTVATEIGDIELAMPRDRNGTFTPMLVAKGQRRLDGLDGMIISSTPAA